LGYLAALDCSSNGEWEMVNGECSHPEIFSLRRALPAKAFL